MGFLCSIGGEGIPIAAQTVAKEKLLLWTPLMLAYV